jgi:hydrogenase expression/formation protein HypC
MCIAIPMMLTEIHGQQGTVEEGGVRHRISLALLEHAEVGHYVLVHAGFAISVLDPEEARETLDLLQQVGIVEEERG